MDDHNEHDATSTPQPQPPRRPRRKRPNGRWSNPASPLQAARFKLRRNGQDVIKAIRRLCPGHAGEPCRIDVSKLSDYETGNRRPGLTHIEAFARLYNKSPEELGLIRWRDDPEQQDPEQRDPGHPGATPPGATPLLDPDDLDPTQAHVIVIYVHALANITPATVASEVLGVLSRLRPVATTPATSEPPAPPAPAEEDDPEPDPTEP